MKKLMGFNFPGDFNLNSNLRLDSNPQIITDLNDLVMSSPLDNDNLLLFVELLVNRFDWINANLEEIDKCKNAVLDLISIDGTCVDWLVKRLITYFKSVNKEHLKVDLCSREFDSVTELKKFVRTILTTSPDDQELAGDNFNFMYELIGYHSSVDLKKKVVSIFPSTHKNPSFKGLRCFFYRDQTGTVDFFSYARCCDNVKTRGQILREHLCDLIIEICKLSPSILGTIADTLDLCYPHHNVQIEHHISFTKAILYLSKILINKLTVIDSEIRLADPVVDVEKVENLRSEKINQLATELLSGQSDTTQYKSDGANWFRDVYDKLRTEEDCDDMSQKLDFLMALVFEDLHLLLNRCNKYNSATINNASITGSKITKNTLQHIQLDNHTSKDTHSKFPLELSTQPGTSTSQTTSVNMKNTSENITKNSYENMTKNSSDELEEMYTPKSRKELRGLSSETCYVNSDSSFSDTTADTLTLNSSSHSTVTSHTLHTLNTVDTVGVDTVNTVDTVDKDIREDSEELDKMVRELFEVFEEVILQAYKCKYVQFIYFYITSFDVKFLKMFLQRLFTIVYDNAQHVIKRRTAASYISSLICRANFVPHHFIISTLTHFFTLLSPFNQFIHNSHTAKSNSHSVKNNSRGNSRGISGVNSKTIGVHLNTVGVTKKLSLFYSILQDILYIICYHTGVVSGSETCVSFIQNTETGLMAYLTSYLDPLSYCKTSVISQAIKSTSHFSNLVCLNEFLRSKNYLLDTKESEHFKWSFYSPIDSFFPFDPYLLHHSRFYIRDKYISQPHTPESPDHNTHTVKPSELVDEVVDAIKSDKKMVEDDLKRVSKCLDDSLGFSSISRSLKAKLDTLRNFNSDTQIEADYDFWNYEHTIQQLEYNTHDQDERVEDLGLGMEDRKHGLLELLTSSSAYKSAITNSKKAKLCQTH